MKEINPKISIIVPIYNSEKFISECLNSIIHQTLAGFEVICVNDGSTDSTQSILEVYQKRDSRIRIINQENAGLSAARNAGIKVATGEYIGFVDSDDWVSSDFFEKLYYMAKENEADIVMGMVDIYYSILEKKSKSTWINTIINTFETDIVVSVADRKKVINTNAVWNKLFLRDFVNQYNFLFYEGLCWEDNPFTVMTTIKANKVCIVRDVVYCYRVHGNSITGKADYNRKPFDIFEIMTRLKVFFTKENINNIEGYKHFYEELLFSFYSNHLFNRIHKKYRKDFFFRVQHEFRQLNVEKTVHLSQKHMLYKVIKNCSYNWFRVVYYLYHLFK